MFLIKNKINWNLPSYTKNSLDKYRFYQTFIMASDRLGQSYIFPIFPFVNVIYFFPLFTLKFHPFPQFPLSLSVLHTPNGNTLAQRYSPSLSLSPYTIQHLPLLLFLFCNFKHFLLPRSCLIRYFSRRMFLGLCLRGQSGF